MLFDIHRGFKKVFGNLLTVSAIMFFALFYYFLTAYVLVHNFISSIFLSNHISLNTKIVGMFLALKDSYESLPTFSIVSIIFMIILLAINTVLAFVLFKRSRAIVGGAEVSTGLLGILVGIFGIGCASCGSILLATILLSGGGVSLAIINTLGVVFAIGGPLLLLLATLLLLRKFGRVEICAVN